MLDTQPQNTRRGSGGPRRASAGRRRPRAVLIAVVLGVLAVAVASVLVFGGVLGSGPGPRIAARKLVSTAGHGCAGARSCPYATVGVVGQPLAGLFRVPEAIAVGRHVFVGDQFSYAVRRFSLAGRLEEEFGSFGSGPGQFGAIGGIALGPGEDVYVIDSTHDHIDRFTPGGRLLESWGSQGSGLGRLELRPGYTADEPPGGAILVSGGYVYVADTSNDRIERFDLDGSHPVVLVGPGRVHDPRGMAIAGGDLYVADDGDHRIDVFGLKGRFLRAAGHFGTVFAPSAVTPGPLEFANPFDVAVDGRNIYVADDNNNRIVELTRGLKQVRAFKGPGGTVLLSYVRALAVGPRGELFVADSGGDQIMIFGPGGRLLRRWGTKAHFIRPLSVATAPNGDAYVIETYESRSPISKLGPGLSYLGAWERGGTSLGAHWFSPSAAAVTAGGSLWVTDTANDLLRQLSSRGRYLGAISPSGAVGNHDPMKLPADVAIGPGGGIYVADPSAHRIEIFAPSGLFERAWGQPGRGQAQLVAPLALDFGPNRDLYVADAGDDRILELGPSGRELAAWGAPGSAPGKLLQPAGIAVDAAGHVFVADTGNDRIAEFTADGRLLALWGARGTALGEFEEPRGLAIDCDGQLLVTDTRNNRIQAFGGVAQAPACKSG